MDIEAVKLVRVCIALFVIVRENRGHINNVYAPLSCACSIQGKLKSLNIRRRSSGIEDDPNIINCIFGSASLDNHILSLTHINAVLLVGGCAACISHPDKLGGVAISRKREVRSSVFELECFTAHINVGVRCELVVGSLSHGRRHIVSRIEDLNTLGNSLGVCCVFAGGAFVCERAICCDLFVIVVSGLLNCCCSANVTRCGPVSLSVAVNLVCLGARKLDLTNCTDVLTFNGCTCVACLFDTLGATSETLVRPVAGLVGFPSVIALAGCYVVTNATCGLAILDIVGVRLENALYAADLASVLIVTLLASVLVRMVAVARGLFGLSGLFLGLRLGLSGLRLFGLRLGLSGLRLLGLRLGLAGSRLSGSRLSGSRLSGSGLAGSRLGGSLAALGLVGRGSLRSLSGSLGFLLCRSLGLLLCRSFGFLLCGSLSLFVCGRLCLFVCGGFGGILGVVAREEREKHSRANCENKKLN